MLTQGSEIGAKLSRPLRVFDNVGNLTTPTQQGLAEWHGLCLARFRSGGRNDLPTISDKPRHHKGEYE